VRSRLAALLRASVRMQRLTALTSIPEIVAARPEPKGGWEIALVRHGRLVAAGASVPPTHPRTVLAALMATAETVRPGPGPTPCASAEESERVLSWLERPEVRLVECPTGWAYPVSGAARFAELLATVDAAGRAGVPGDADQERRPWRRRNRRVSVAAESAVRPAESTDRPTRMSVG